MGGCYKIENSILCNIYLLYNMYITCLDFPL